MAGAGERVRRMKWIFTVMLAAATVCGGLTGRMEEVSNAALTGGQEAVSLALRLTAALCLWSGVLKVAEAAGLTDRIAGLLSPVLGRIFPRLEKGDPARRYIAMNMTANLLGLGNAATPFGLKAAEALAARGEPGRASNELIYLVVLNTASLQLLPTTVASLRAVHGAAAPLDILPAVWLSSAAALFTALGTAWLLGRRRAWR